MSDNNLAPGSRWAGSSAIIDSNGVTIGCAPIVDGDQFVYVGHEDNFVGVHKLDFCAFATAQYGLRPQPVGIHNDLNLGYQAGQVDGCARADELLAAVWPFLLDDLQVTGASSSDGFDTTSDSERRFITAVERVGTYLHEKGLIP